jgi:Fic-DOC domain mobile mystery protein B
MGLEPIYLSGQTPLDEDEKDGLLIKTVTTHGELDEFEQQNIEKAMLWTIKKRFKADKILNESFIKQLHREMYGDVWSWAGKFRKTNKNIGIDKLQISTALRALIDDCKFWVANKSFDPDEIAIRFKHRIVSIHCFSNGNGRHSRMMADVIIEKIFNKELFTWGAAGLGKPGEERTEYLKALRTADAGKFDLLIAFART